MSLIGLMGAYSEYPQGRITGVLGHLPVRSHTILALFREEVRADVLATQ